MYLNSGIEISNIKTLFSSLCSRNNNNDNCEFISKIRVYNFFAINEIKNCVIIRSIPYYQNKYNILYNYEILNIGQFNGKAFDILETIHDKGQKYLLFQYKNSDYIMFSEYLFQIKTPKLFIRFVIESYTFLLNSLIELNNRSGICFFDLSHKNIVLPFDCREKPILTCFQNSMRLSKIDEPTISKIIDGINDYTYKPLEVYVLFYLIKNDLNTISYSLIEEICDFYIANLTVLTLFSLEYQKNFKNLCIRTLKNYINEPKSGIIIKIIKHHSTWDNYSLSLLYLHIVANILRVFSCKKTFISEFGLILLKNISPEPTDRDMLEKTSEKLKNLYYAFTEWTFVNKIPVEKMALLVKYIAE
jgi:hypothetical protein